MHYMIADHHIYSQTRDEHSSCEILAQLKEKFEYSKVSDENISNEFCYSEEESMQLSMESTFFG